jgi:L-seryl-tRNA(Ser) seleniumtransferase
VTEATRPVVRGPGNDRFGFAIDPRSGFARGHILASDVEDALRLDRAWSMTADRVRLLGPRSISVFTGSACDFPLAPSDLDASCNDWIGPALVRDALRDRGVEHLGGGSDDTCIVLARTTAAVLAWIDVHARNGVVLSVVPTGGHSHVSVRLGADMARARLIEVAVDELKAATVRDLGPFTVVATPITSSLERMSDAEIDFIVGLAHTHGARVLLDDAYGARVRPILFGGRRSLEFNADVVVGNTDKAGLGGPRATLVAGNPVLVTELFAWAAARGMDARAPVVTSVLRALERFRPDDLLQEVADAEALADELVALLGDIHLQRGPLGATITEEDLLDLLRWRGSVRTSSVVPYEATAGVAMLLLKDHGFVTVNTHGQPGARASLRFKPVLGHLDRAGGADAVARAVDQTINQMAEFLQAPAVLAHLLLGHPSRSV